MILPTKHLVEDRSILHVGAEILILLETPKTVSRLWLEMKSIRENTWGATTLSYDWFVLALDFLYALGIIEFERGQIRKASK